MSVNVTGLRCVCQVESKGKMNRVRNKSYFPHPSKPEQINLTLITRAKTPSTSLADPDLMTKTQESSLPNRKQIININSAQKAAPMASSSTKPLRASSASSLLTRAVSLSLDMRSQSRSAFRFFASFSSIWRRSFSASSSSLSRRERSILGEALRPPGMI